MNIKINMHGHERVGSYDSITPSRAMASVYNSMGYSAVGFVGHDEMANVKSENLIIFNGIEETVSTDPEIHVVRFPEMGFSFLAHPGRTDMDKEEMEQFIRDNNLDGVEKFSNGVEQFEGDVPAIELANDDAHNILQIGTSFMEVEVNDINRGQIVQALKRGDVELKNNRRRIAGQSLKAVNSTMGTLIHGR